MQISHNEYQIMELLWREQKPLSRADILRGTAGRNWNPASIHLILNSMLSKSVIKITDENKKYARTYEAVLTQEEYLCRCIEDSLPGKSNEDRLRAVVMALVNRDGIREEDVAMLEEILAEKRKELTEKAEKGKKRKRAK